MRIGLRKQCSSRADAAILSGSTQLAIYPGGLETHRQEAYLTCSKFKTSMVRS